MLIIILKLSHACMYWPTETAVLFDMSIKLRSRISNSFFVHGVTSPLPVVSTTLRVSGSLKALNTLTYKKIESVKIVIIFAQIIAC